MNNIRVIRKNSYKDYLKPSIPGGFILGLFWALITLLSTGSISTSAVTGLFVWLLVIMVFVGIGFPSEEYFNRKKRIRKLQSPKYTFLDKSGFKLHEDLYFEGVYEGYYIRVLPMTRWAPKGKGIDYDVIEAYYTFADSQ